MSSNPARPNTSTEVGGDPASQLRYAPRVNPSPLTVGSGNGSLEIVITNPDSLAVNVKGIEFLIKVAGAHPDGSALTTSTANVRAAVSDSRWVVEMPNGSITQGYALFKLGPAVGRSMEIPAGGSLVVQIYQFPINVVAGTSTIIIKEDTEKGVASSHLTVTTFPWGFAFSDLVARVPDGNGWRPVAQVENGQSVTLFWRSSVLDPGAYTIYYSNSQGQQTSTPKRSGEWTSPALTEDTVFTLGVRTNNSVQDPLIASMSIAVAVRNPDLIVTNLEVLKTTTLSGDLAVGSDASRPKLTVYSSPLIIDADDNVVFSAESFKVGNALSIDQGGHVSLGGSTIKSQQAGETALTVLQTQGGSSESPAENAIEVGGFDMQSDQHIAVKVAGGYRYSAGIKLKASSDGVGFTIDYNDKESALQILRQFVNTPTLTPALEIRVDTGNLTAYGALKISNTPLGQLLNGDTAGGYIYNFKNDADNLDYLCVGGIASSSDSKKRIWLDVDMIRITGALVIDGQVWHAAEGRWRYLENDGGTNRWAYWIYGTPAASDLRFKREVRPVPSALDKVRRLRGVTFSWNEDALQHFTRDIETTLSAGPNATEPENQKVWQKERDQRRNQLAATHVGVVAQEVEAVLPEAVTTDADGYKLVRYNELIPLLIEAIKEQDRLAARQQAEIERLKLAVGLGESPDAHDRAR